MRLPSATPYVAALTLAGALLTGCGNGSAPATPVAQPAPTSAIPTPAACPGSRAAVRPWPHGIPADLPAPPGVRINADQTQGDGVRIIRFTNGMSLRESVLFVVKRLPKAGYVLGRGDAEASEADAPFVRGDVRGMVKMIAMAPCRTMWLLATVKVSQQQPGGGSPLLPSHSPSGSPSPLPFG